MERLPRPVYRCFSKVHSTGLIKDGQAFFYLQIRGAPVHFLQ
jgi:hypothetical protein